MISIFGNHTQIAYFLDRSHHDFIGTFNHSIIGLVIDNLHFKFLDKLRNFMSDGGVDFLVESLFEQIATMTSPHYFASFSFDPTDRSAQIKRQHILGWIGVLKLYGVCDIFFVAEFKVFGLVADGSWILALWFDEVDFGGGSGDAGQL